MLKTNTTKARNNIKKYIINHYDNERYDTAPANTSTFEEIATYIYKEFIIEKLPNACSRTWYYTEQEAFIDWAKGLPTIIDTCYYYNRSAKKDLQEILEETEKETNKYTEPQSEEFLTKLIYREIIKGCRTNI